MTVRLRARNDGKFGNAELDRLNNSEKSVPRTGLFRKLRFHAHGKVAKLTDEEAKILLSQFVNKVESDGPIQAEEAGQKEIDRVIKLGNIASRPFQKEFSSKIRKLYDGTVVTGCTTAEALQAAHIRIADGLDDNDASNGILLRADIHALFRPGLVTLASDGSRLELSRDFSDVSYDFLR